MFNREKVKTFKDTANRLADENVKLIALIRRANLEFVPCDFRRSFVIGLSPNQLLERYLDELEEERKREIQDDILREKVEKIVLALREHKWEPA
jgi:hypothetical protein